MLIKINLLKNSIGADQAEAFGDILVSHPTLKSLCGLDPDATEADFSNQGLKSDDAILIAHSIKFNSPMRKITWGDGEKVYTVHASQEALDLSGRGLQAHDAQIVAAMLPKCT